MLALIAEFLIVGIPVLLLCGFVYERITFYRERRTYSHPRDRIDIGGYALQVRRMGSGSPIVVIATGGGQPAVAWEPVQRAIAEFTTAYSYDRSYIGWSGDDGARCTIENRVAELHRLLAATGDKGPLVLVGHSYSGFVVRTFTRRYPGEVGALVVVDCTEEEFISRPEFLSMWRVARWPLVWRALVGTFGGMKARIAMRPIEAVLPAGFSEMARAEFKAIVSHQRYWLGNLREVGSLMEPRERRFLQEQGCSGTLAISR